MRFVSYVSVRRSVRTCYPYTPQRQIMKKAKHNYGHKKKSSVKISEEKPTTETVEKPQANLDDEDEQGFGGWLKSPDGMDTMKLFVIANSIVMLTTLVYPHIQTVFEILYDMAYGPDEIY